MRASLGFDTSNYKTSAALFNIKSGEAQSEGKLLTVAHGELGLRQSDALFQHVKSLPDILATLDIKNKGDITSVGYSSRPRNLESSYMPCFLAGTMAAKCVSSVLCVPIFEFSHQQGHVASALYSINKLDLLKESFLSWHISGGTTELLLVKPSANNIIDIEIIGGTEDLAAGQIIDRAGVALGLDFPCGAKLDELAKGGAPDFFAPKSRGLFFSLSGVQNKFEDKIKSKNSPADVAAYAINSVVSIIEKVTQLALREYNLPILFSGGVAASSQMRIKLGNAQNVYFAKPQFSGDNAAGTAIMAAIAAEEKI